MCTAFMQVVNRSQTMLKKEMEELAGAFKGAQAGLLDKSLIQLQRGILRRRSKFVVYPASLTGHLRAGASGFSHNSAALIAKHLEAAVDGIKLGDVGKRRKIQDAPTM